MRECSTISPWNQIILSVDLVQEEQKLDNGIVEAVLANRSCWVIDRLTLEYEFVYCALFWNAVQEMNVSWQVHDSSNCDRHAPDPAFLVVSVWFD